MADHLLHSASISYIYNSNELSRFHDLICRERETYCSVGLFF